MTDRIDLVRLQKAITTTANGTIVTEVTAGANGSTSQLVLVSNGNVGIGTASPDALLTVNTVASFGAGAAALPSIAAKGDLDTGLWFPTADTIAASTGGTERLRIDSSGNATFAGTLVPNSSFLRNRIINGDMRIDQRNAGASFTPTDPSYSLDRWKFRVSQTSKLTVQQNAGAVTTPAGFSNYLGVTSSSAYTVTSSDFFVLVQDIEGYNFSDFDFGTANAKTLTISFWVRSSITGTFNIAIRNSAANRSYPVTYTILAANTWEQKTISIAGDTSGTWIGATNGIGLSVIFNLGSGSTFNGTSGSWQAANYTSVSGATSVVGTNGATFYITGVQLEVGTAATPFERRQYGQELSLCQRYYEANINTTGGFGVAVGFSGNIVSGGTYYNAVNYIVPKRAAPTITLYNANLAGFPSASALIVNGTTSFLMSGVANATNTQGYYFYDLNVSAEL